MRAARTRAGIRLEYQSGHYDNGEKRRECSRKERRKAEGRHRGKIYRSSCERGKGCRRDRPTRTVEIKAGEVRLEWPREVWMAQVLPQVQQCRVPIHFGRMGALPELMIRSKGSETGLRGVQATRLSSPNTYAQGIETELPLPLAANQL
jgi:hypothetical protein